MAKKYMEQGISFIEKQSQLLFVLLLGSQFAFFGLSFIWDSPWLFIPFFMVAVFGLYPLYGLRSEKEALQNQDIIGIESTLRLADQTMSYLQDGLDHNSAMTIANILKDISNIPAVGITDRENVLAFVGEGCEKHPAGYPIRTRACVETMNDGKTRVINKKKEFNCNLKDCVCPLSNAVIVPIRGHQEIVGALQFYGLHNRKVNNEDIRLAVGMSKLLGMQLELANYDRQLQLNAKAKLDALQAQINPHFLFNALNTINMYILKDPEYARELILRLSTLLRYLLGNTQHLVTLSKELSHLEDYLSIENARYQNKIRVIYKIDSALSDILIPVLSIQPLVHNAINHGILPKNMSGTIEIMIEHKGKDLIIAVKDNGLGIEKDKLDNIYKKEHSTGCGIGINNLNQRLKLLYGSEYQLVLSSEVGKGTVATFNIPYSKQKVGD